MSATESRVGEVLCHGKITKCGVALTYSPILDPISVQFTAHSEKLGSLNIRMPLDLICTALKHDGRPFPEAALNWSMRFPGDGNCIVTGRFFGSKRVTAVRFPSDMFEVLSGMPDPSREIARHVDRLCEMTVGWTL
jgi:hypothetical protein